MLLAWRAAFRALLALKIRQAVIASVIVKRKLCVRVSMDHLNQPSGSVHHDRIEGLLHRDRDACSANPESCGAARASRGCSALEHRQHVARIQRSFLVMSITIDKARAKERASPDTVAPTGVDRNAGAAQVGAIVWRCGRGRQPESEKDAVNRKLGPSVPGKEMHRRLWTGRRDEIDDDGQGYRGLSRGTLARKKRRREDRHTQTML